MNNHISRQQVFSLKHQAVRDLAWSLWGPSLFIHPRPYSENRDCFPCDWLWLCQLDQEPKALNDYLDNKNTRLLGTYFEALWQFYFTHHPNFQSTDEVKSHFNLQVIDRGKTLGEFDILLQIHPGQILHIELACKFYLQWFDADQQGLWIGPNCGDRLDIKYHKTHSHQLPLLDTQQGLQTATQIFSQQHKLHVEQLAIWRGKLFPQQLWFHYRSQALEELLTQQADTCWLIADKRAWLSPVVANTDEVQSGQQILEQLNQHFRHKSFTLMLIKLALDPDSAQWQQQEQYFITPANWPYGKLSDSASTALRPCRPPL